MFSELLLPMFCITPCESDCVAEIASRSSSDLLLVLLVVCPKLFFLACAGVQPASRLVWLPPGLCLLGMLS